MNRELRIALTIVGGLILLCCIAGGLVSFLGPTLLQNLVEDTISEDPADVAALAADITDYTLPPGFEEEAAVSLLNMTMIIIENQNNSMGIVMMQFPDNFSGDPEQMADQLMTAFSAQTGTETRTFTEVGRESVSINGELVELVTGESTTDGGEIIRQATAVFTTKTDAQAMLMIMSDADDWNETAVNDFINSMQLQGR